MTTTTSPTSLSTKIPSTTKVTTRKSIKYTTQPTTPEEILTKITTRKTIETTFPSQAATRPTTSIEITSEVMSSAPATWHSSLPTLPLTAGKSSKTTSVVITTDSHEIKNSEIPNSSSTTPNAVTSTESTSFVLSQEMVILMVGIGVVEVTIIIVGILAVNRFRQQRKNTTNHSKENVGRPVSRKTVCSIDNVYATIPEEEFEENPYKDLSEGVYDTTSKRRSHVNGSWSNHSRGSFYSCLFRISKIGGRRSVQEMHPMFSTFRDTKKETK